MVLIIHSSTICSMISQNQSSPLTVSLSYPYHPYYHQTLCRVVGTTFFKGNRFRKQPQEGDPCGRPGMVVLAWSPCMVAPVWSPWKEKTDGRIRNLVWQTCSTPFAGQDR